MASPISISVAGPRKTRTYKSVREAARALTGSPNPTKIERMRGRIRRIVDNGGGYIGTKWVETVERQF